MRSFKLLSALVVVLVFCAASTSNAALYLWAVKFSGAAEAPPNSSLGTGTGSVLYDDVAHTLTLNATFSGLTGNVTNSHIHAATATALTGTSGVATTTPTFAGFPSGVTAGSYSNTLNMTLASSYNPAFITANGGTPATAEVALFNAMLAGKAYWNIHTTFVPAGEVRGFLVPEPATAGLGIVGGIFALARRAKRKVVA